MSMGFGWRALIAAEMIGGDSGLGFMIFVSAQEYKIEEVFLGVLTIAVICIEVSLIASIMLTGDANPTLARDTMFAVLMIVLIVASFHHMQLGLQVVIEDYIHGEGIKIVSLMAMKGGSLLLAILLAGLLLVSSNHRNRATSS